MADASNVQTSFLGGEWGKFAQGRTEHPRYRTAMAVCRNAVPVEEGSCTRRPGFRFADTTRNGAAGYLLPFPYGEDEHYDLELTDSHIRLLKGRDVIAERVSYVISDISGASPAVFTTATANTWATGDQVRFRVGSIAACGNLHVLIGRTFRIVVLTSTTFKIYDPITGVSVDGGDLTWVSTYSLTVHKNVDFSSPYTASQIETVRSVQSEENAVLLHESVAPRVLSLDTESDGELPAEFSLSTAVLKDGPYLDPFPDSIATPDATNGLINLSLSYTAYSSSKAYTIGDRVTSVGIAYRSLTDQNVNHTPASNPSHWVKINPGEVVGPNGFEASDIGRLVRMFSGNAPGSLWTWGKIVNTSTTGKIDLGAVGSGTFGNMQSQAAAFDGVIYTSSNHAFYSDPLPYFAGWIGSAFSVAQTVSSVVVYPSYNYGWAGGSQVTISLYGKNGTGPASSTDGTLLGSSGSLPGFYNPPPDYPNTALAPVPTAPTTILSNDVTTTWEWLWIRIQSEGGETFSLRAVSEIQFFNASGIAGSGCQVQVLGPALANTTAMTTWRLGVYGERTGYPSCGCYHEGRLWLAGAIKNRFDASKSNDTFNFEPTAGGGTVAGSNAISYTLNAPDKNQIVWMQPVDRGIIAGSLGGEWFIRSGDGGAITPTNIKASRATKYECAAVEPVQTGLTTVFVQKHKRRIIEYLDDAYSGKLFGPELSEFAKHLTKTFVHSLIFQDGLTPILWMHRGDGKLIGCSYRRISSITTQPPEYAAWHQHDLGSGRIVESVALTTDPETGIDTPLIITNDPTTGVRHVELMSAFPDEDDTLIDAQYLDSAIVPAAITTGVDTQNAAGLRFYGLHHLEGKTVTAWVAGLDCGDHVVADGSIFIRYGHVGLFTKQYLTEVSTSGVDFAPLTAYVDGGALSIPALIGFTYTTQGQVLRPGTAPDAGSRNGPPFGKVRRNHEFAVLLANTRGVKFGTKFSRLRPAKLTTEGGTPLDTDELFSGVHCDKVDDSYGFDGMLCWEVDRPYPATIAAIGGFLHTQDK